MRKRDYEKEIDPRVVRYAVERPRLNCSICPPHRGENRVRRPKHGARPPRSKNRKA